MFQYMNKQGQYILFFVLIFLFCFSFPLKSQEYKFKTLGVENGLSQITVSDICQDEKSRIWIATLDGLNCYDGNHIKVFNHFHNDSISYGNLYTRVRDNILKSKEQKNIQPTKGGHKMVTCQNYVSLFYRQITSCPSDGGIS